MNFECSTFISKLFDKSFPATRNRTRDHLIAADFYSQIAATHLRGQIFKRSLRGSSAAEACHQQRASPLGNPQVTKQEPSAELREPEQLRTRSFPTAHALCFAIAYQHSAPISPECFGCASCQWCSISQTSVFVATLGRSLFSLVGRAPAQ